MRRVPKLLVPMAAFAVLVSGCSESGTGDSGDSSSSDVIKIGVINPFSGPNAAGGQAIYEGYELAVEEANADGGIDGKKIELIKGDASKPEQGIAEVDRLASSEDVDIFAGTYVSGVAETASQAAAKLDKLYWDTNALAANLTDRGLSNFVRSGPAAPEFAASSVDATTEFIAGNLGKQLTDLTVFISYEDSVYGSSIAEIQKQNLEAAGVTVLDSVAYSAASPDLSAVILKAKEANPDVWIETGYVPDGVLLLKTASSQGFKPPSTLLVGTGDTTDTLDGVGVDALDSTLVVAYPHSDISPEYGPGAAEYAKAYKDKYGSDPKYPQSMTAYAGMQMLLKTVDEADSVATKDVREAAASMDDAESTYATGYGMKFDDNFQNTLAIPTVVQWQAGKTVTVYPEAAAPEGAAFQPSS